MSDTPKRPRLLPCGCRPPGYGAPPQRHCAESEQLWEAVQALRERATTGCPEWLSYVQHFERRGRLKHG